MSPNERIRTLIGKLPAGVLVVAALGGFWVLTGGMTRGPGTITGYAEERVHSVGSLQAGRIQAVSVQLGQAVRAGEVVALLDTRPLELQREQLRAELAQAQAELVAGQDIQSALLQRGQLQAVRVHAVEERERAELRELDQQVKRLEKLGAAHLIRASEVEEARRRQRAVAADLEARLVGSARELEQMGLRPRAQADQAERLQQRIAPLQAALRVKEAALHQIELALAEMTLRAPVDGTIGAILQQPGDVVSVGAPVLSVITMRPGYVVAFVPERRIAGITAGSAVKLRRIGILTSALSGHVAELAPMVEEVPARVRPSPTVPTWARRVVIKLDEPAQLLPGEAFRVSAN